MKELQQEAVERGAQEECKGEPVQVVALASQLARARRDGKLKPILVSAAGAEAEKIEGHGGSMVGVLQPRAGLVYQIVTGKGSPHQVGGGEAAREAAGRMSLQGMAVEKCSRHMIKVMLDEMPKRPLHYLVYRGGMVRRASPVGGGPGVPVYH